MFTAIAAVLAAVIASALTSAGEGLKYLGGVSAGGLIAYFNLIWLAAIVRRLLLGSSTGKRFALTLAAKIILLYTIVSALVALRLVEPAPFLIGLSGLFVSVLAAGIRKGSKGE